MTNIVIFGKNNYLVDIVGHWLGGHSPGISACSTLPWSGASST